MWIKGCCFGSSFIGILLREIKALINDKILIEKSNLIKGNNEKICFNNLLESGNKEGTIQEKNENSVIPLLSSCKRRESRKFSLGTPNNVYFTNSFLKVKDHVLEEMGRSLGYNLNYNSFKVNPLNLDTKNSRVTGQALIKRSSNDLCRKKFSEDLERDSIFEPIFSNVKHQFDDKADLYNSSKNLKKSPSPKRQLMFTNLENHFSTLSQDSNNYHTDLSWVSAMTSPRLKKSSKKIKPKNFSNVLKIRKIVNFTLYSTKKVKKRFDMFSVVSGVECLDIDPSQVEHLCEKCKNLIS